MDYARKTTGSPAKEAADIYTGFVKECEEKGINLSPMEKRTVNTQIRNMVKKKDLSNLDFMGLAQELSEQVSPIFDYLAALSDASFEKALKSLDVEQESVEPALENISPAIASSENIATKSTVPPSVNAVEKISQQDEPVSKTSATLEISSNDGTAAGSSENVSTASNLKPSTEEETVPDVVKISTSQSRTLDALSRIKDMRGGKVVDASRRREIAKEINSLKVQRDTKTRNISMRAEDMAVLTSILEYAESKEGKEKIFLGCSMDKWNGIFHVAIDCMIEKLGEEGRNGYLNAIANGQVKEQKRRENLDLKINKLLAEKEGI